jgi:cell division septum initiation protein DivIVA
MGAHHRQESGATERPTFDEVARGYDPRQVDDYLATLWRYASQVTSRAAAAEAALRHEQDRREAESRMSGDNPTAQAGGRIGLMLAIAEQEADEIVTGARHIAERALEEAIEDAASNHPIVREAREQADRLLLDAVEESRQRAKLRHSDIEAQISRSMASLEKLRHQQGEIIGAMLRLRGLISTQDIDHAVADLARSGTSIPEAPESDAAPHSSSSGPSTGQPLGEQPTIDDRMTAREPPPAQRVTSPRATSRASRVAGRRLRPEAAEAEIYPDEQPVRAATAYRPVHDDDIIDAEVVEE